MSSVRKHSHAALHARYPLSAYPVDGDGTAAKIGDYATEGEVYRFVMQSYRNFEQAVYGHVDEAGSSGDERTGVDLTDSVVMAESTLQAAIFEGRRRKFDAVPAEEFDALSSSIHDVMATRLRDNVCTFERLEHVVDR